MRNRRNIDNTSKYISPKHLLGSICWAALILGCWPSPNAWADGGRGSTVGLVPGGAGGVDGTPGQAAGQAGETVSTGSGGSGGGGGGVDLTTGSGAAGGARGIGGIGTGAGAVLGTAGSAGAAGTIVTTSQTISTGITGGLGGAGQAQVNNVNTTGGSGGGAAGISATADVTIGAGGSATGGAGRQGFNAAGSGGGGVGVFSSASVIVDAGGHVTGGAGGGNFSTPTIGTGGGGGMGVVLLPGGSLTNAGSIVGGAGGSGGSIGGGGGDGGAGVLVTGGGTLINAAGGTIVGGAGGNARYSATGPVLAGLGGAGVEGANITLINAGSITGAIGGTNTGAGAPATVQAAAVQFTGGVNSLEIRAGSTINGNVIAFSTADTLKLGGSTDATFDVSALGETAQYRGFGNFEKTGTSTWTLTGTTDYSGNTTVAEGTLRAGAAGAFSAASTFSVANGAQLDLAGIDQTVAGLTNGGLVTLNTPNGKPGTTLTVTGNYVGQGGTIAMNTYLGGDGSATDRLVINGNASGNTLLDIRNVGGPGALTTGNGIPLIQVGGTSTANAFQLAHAVAIGAFDYGLFMNAADQDWYLRSAGANGGPVLNGSAQTSSVYADALGNYALASLGTLQQRNGNRIWPDGAPPQLAADLPSSQAMRYAPGGPVLYGAGAWGRVAGQYASYDPKLGSAYTQSLGFMQAGYEGVAYEAAAGSLSFGAYATIGTSRADIDLTKDPITGAARGEAHITSTGYGLGATTTWLGNDGLYADGIGQFTWYDSDLSNTTGGNQAGWSSALSLEVGKRFALGSGWAIVPQAQLAWTHVDFDSFTDENGAVNELGKGDSLRGRAGLRLEKLDSWKAADGQTSRLQFYGLANLNYEFLDGTSVEIDSTEVEQQNKKLWGEVGLGGTYAWNDKWSVNGEASYGAALASDAGSNYAVKGTVGLHYKW
jgi:outer membrane autotransporter protein